MFDGIISMTLTNLPNRKVNIDQVLQEIERQSYIVNGNALLNSISNAMTLSNSIFEDFKRIKAEMTVKKENLKPNFKQI